MADIRPSRERSHGLSQFRHLQATHVGLICLPQETVGSVPATNEDCLPSMLDPVMIACSTADVNGLHQSL